jgi:glycosyltransferase involved in cell wall biosynthesis
MIDFFPTWSRDAADTAFGRALRDIGVPHRIFATTLSFRYRSRLKLVFVWLPRLALFSLRSAFASLGASRPAPAAVVLGTDIQVLVFAAVRALFRRPTRIVLGSFILTSRASARVDTLRTAYYRLVLSRTDVAVVHSRLEVERYRALFPGVKTRFVFVPYSLDIESRERLIAEAAARSRGPRPVVVSAGRSGRDYAMLVEAMAGVDAELRIVCDYADALPPPPYAADVTVLRDCYDERYLHELLAADVVVVPLAATDISAGQMVMIQAMCLGRPLLVTDTPSIRDYVTDGHDALLTPARDAAAMRDDIRRLLADPALRERLGRNAAETFARNHSTRGFLTRMLSSIGALEPTA